MSNESAQDVQTLIDAASAHIDDDDGGSLASGQVPLGWDAIWQLHRMPTRDVLDAAVASCRSPNASLRRVGASVLGQLGHSAPDFEPTFVDERFETLHDLLAAEEEGRADIDVLADACIALGHLHDERAIDRIASFRNHPATNVRHAVVHGLSGHDHDLAIHPLIELTRDPENLVRDWATFGLGQLIKTDTIAIRAALYSRLDDADIDTRNEAITGLALRKDKAVIPTLIGELERQIASPLLEAAADLADPALCDALFAAERRGLSWNANGQSYNLRDYWEKAVRACGCPPQP